MNRCCLWLVIFVEEESYCRCVFFHVVIICLGVLAAMGYELLFRLWLGIVQWSHHAERHERVGISVYEKHRAAASGYLPQRRCLAE